MIRALLADLDGTLVNSDALSRARDARQWRECARRSSEVVVFDGVRELLAALRERSIRLGIVTSTVSYYAEAVLRGHRITYDKLVAYHDTPRRKPHPDPFVKALRDLNIAEHEAIGLGDALADLQALKAAGVHAVAAGWNAACPRDGWDTFAATPRDLIELFSRT